MLSSCHHHVEFITDPAAKEPASRQTARLLEKARDRNLLLGKSGIHGNVLRIKPPLCITRDDAEFIAAVIGECLGSG